MSQIWAIAPYGKKAVGITYIMEGKKFNDVFQYDLKNNVIAIGAGSMRKPEGTFADPSGLTIKEIVSIIKKNHPEYSSNKSNGMAYVLWQIYNEVKEGDFIVAKSGLREIMAIGKVFAKNGKVSFFSVKTGLERTGNKYNPHPNFINVEWKEDHMKFGVDVFLRDRFGELRKMVASKYYAKYGCVIEQRIKELWGKDCIFDDIKNTAYDKNVKNLSKSMLFTVNPEEKLRKINDQNIPDWLKKLQEKVLLLRKDRDHQERAHESLVEMFYEGLGYERFVDIQYRKGRIDVSLVRGERVFLITEVKKNWGLTIEDEDVLMQAYNYAHDTGARYVVITNGDYYGIFDRDNGKTYKEQLIGEFSISKLRSEDIKSIEKMGKSNID